MYVSENVDADPWKGNLHQVDLIGRVSVKLFSIRQNKTAKVGNKRIPVRGLREVKMFAQFSYGVSSVEKYWDGSDAPTGSMVETINIASYASAHGWTNDASEFPQTITQGNVTLTASNAEGQNQNGNYNTQWRFYQARGGGLTVTVSNGHSLVRVTFTCGTGSNGGILIAPDRVTQLPSGTPCSLSGNSAMFTIGSSTGKTNGRVDITQIVIEYE